MQRGICGLFEAVDQFVVDTSLFRIGEGTESGHQSYSSKFVRGKYGAPHSVSDWATRPDFRRLLGLDFYRGGSFSNRLHHLEFRFLIAVRFTPGRPFPPSRSEPWPHRWRLSSSAERLRKSRSWRFDVRLVVGTRPVYRRFVSSRLRWPRKMISFVNEKMTAATG